MDKKNKSDRVITKPPWKKKNNSYRLKYEGIIFPCVRLRFSLESLITSTCPLALVEQNMKINNWSHDKNNRKDQQLIACHWLLILVCVHCHTCSVLMYKHLKVVACTARGTFLPESAWLLLAWSITCNVSCYMFYGVDFIDYITLCTYICTQSLVK